LSTATTVNGTLQLSGQPLGIGAVTSGVTNLVVATLNTGGATNTVNISSVPISAAINDAFGLIRYASIVGSTNDFTLGTMPAGYTGHITNIDQTILLVITAVPLPKSITWIGSPIGNWTTDATTKNWLLGVATNYVSSDLVTFDDTATGTTTVTLTNTLTPGSLLVSNVTQSYTFTGAGSIGGVTGLTKEGANSLTLANTGTNTFIGGIALNAGSLIYDRADTNTEANVITGAGALVKNGAGTLTLSQANSYGGGSTVNAGTLRLGTGTSAGSGAVSVESGATLVAGGSHLNSLTLSNGSLGGIAGSMTLSGALTVPTGTSNLVYTTDPQNNSALANLTTDGTLSGSGDIQILAGTGSSNPDSTTAACRFYATVDGGYSGTIRVGNLVKADIKTTIAAPAAFSPIGTGKLVLACGTSGGGSFIGTWCNLIVRNSSGGDAIFGNNVELVGTGLACINPTQPVDATTTMGSLTIGDGQNLGVYASSGVKTLAFPTVSLTGGTATFSPRPVQFAATVNNPYLSLGNISGTLGSSIVMNGWATLFITGTASHTGSTTVSNGTLNVSGALAGSGPVIVAGGSLAGTGTIAGPVTVQSGGTLAPGASVGTLTINNSLTLAGNVLVEVDNSLTPSNDVVTVSGTLTYGGTLTATNIGGGALVLGDQFKVFKNGGTGNFTSILGSPGAGLVWAFTPATGTLSVIPSGPTGPGTITNSYSLGVLSLSWPAGEGWRLQAQTNSLSSGLGTNWVYVTDYSVSSTNTTINPANPSVFYRLTYP